MIQVPTVLILGAGASMPYGFPSGFGLLQDVCRNLSHDSEVRRILLVSGFETRHLEAFRESLFRSGRASVDAFLEQRPEFIDVGKAAIAAALIPYENEGLFILERSNNWYQYLWSQIGATWEGFGSNRLTIVTYNYDRSLEWYLFNCLLHSFGKSDVECVKKLREIPILHVHGLLGELLIPPIADGRPYGPRLFGSDVTIAAKGIRIIHEDIHKETALHDAKQRLFEAKVICFLGFGYHSLNLQRLEISKLRQGRNVCGTIRGLKQAELLQLSKDIGYLLDTAGDAEILDFLRDEAIFSIGT